MSKFKIAALLAASLLGMGQVQAAPATDTVQAPAGFFVPTDAQRYDVPYYRWNGEGWGWTHGLIAGAIGTANLNISAFDVDQAQGENDNVYAMDGASWVLLGHLQGGNDIWAFSTFALGPQFFDDINLGLQVKIEIDTANMGWAATLAKSSLSVDEGALPPPIPGIPEPGTYAMLLAGLAAVGSIARRRQPK